MDLIRVLIKETNNSVALIRTEYEQYRILEQIEKQHTFKELTLNSINETELKRIKKMPLHLWLKEYVVSEQRLNYIFGKTERFLTELLIRLRKTDKPMSVSNLASRRVTAVLNAVVEHLHLAKITNLKYQETIFNDCRNIISKTYGDILLIANKLEDLQCFDESAVNIGPKP